MEALALLVTDTNLVLYEGTKEEAEKIKASVSTKELGARTLTVVIVDKNEYEHTKKDIIKLEQLIRSKR